MIRHDWGDYYKGMPINPRAVSVDSDGEDKIMSDPLETRPYETTRGEAIDDLLHGKEPIVRLGILQELMLEFAATGMLRNGRHWHIGAEKLHPGIYRVELCK